MPTILRSSAVGKLRLGRTTTVPTPRSSGSLAGYRTAKVRCSSSKGTIGGADHIAKDNQSFGVRASPDFAESSFSARPLGGGRPRGRHGGIIEGMTQSITFYDAVGGEPTFRRLVAGFYRRVATDPVLRPLYPDEDLAGAEERLRLFLMQYWGGPRTYSDARGHPRLPMRHAPFAVTPAARDAWLRHMRAAVDELALAEPYRTQLWDYLEYAAQSMVNRAE